MNGPLYRGYYIRSNVSEEYKKEQIEKSKQVRGRIMRTLNACIEYINEYEILEGDDPSDINENYIELFMRCYGAGAMMEMCLEDVGPYLFEYRYEVVRDEEDYDYVKDYGYGIYEGTEGMVFDAVSNAQDKDYNAYNAYFGINNKSDWYDDDDEEDY